MYLRDNPKVNSQELTYTSFENKIKLKDASKPLIEIWNGGNENPYETVTLNRDSRKYMHATLK